MRECRPSWARTEKTRRITFFDPSLVDSDALLEQLKGWEPGFMIAAPRDSFQTVDTGIKIRPTRFVSHVPGRGGWR